VSPSQAATLRKARLICTDAVNDYASFSRAGNDAMALAHADAIEFAELGRAKPELTVSASPRSAPPRP
jgi:hypothetical protein